MLVCNQKEKRASGSVHNDLQEYRELKNGIANKNAIFASLLVLQDTAYTAKHLCEGFQEDP